MTRYRTFRTVLAGLGQRKSVRVPVEHRIYSATWYGRLVDASSIGQSALGDGRRFRGIASILWRLRRGDIVIATEGALKPAGLVALLGGLIVRRQRALVLLEFLPGRRTGAWGTVLTLAYRQLIRRVALVVQVMTEWERAFYSDIYRIPMERIVHLPFYEYDDRVPADFRQSDGVVMASGRNSCDWATLLAAAKGQGWDLVIVCASGDSPRVTALAADQPVKILVDVPRVQHDAILARSSVYVLTLLPTERSAGHVRLMGAATYAVPVVATDVPGINGYRRLATSIVPTGDHVALRAAVNDLLRDEARRRELAQAISRKARLRPYSLYADEIRKLISDATEAATVEG
jgi:glycosyltransferase involved in cell wall biosynthesis